MKKQYPLASIYIFRIIGNQVEVSNRINVQNKCILQGSSPTGVQIRNKNNPSRMKKEKNELTFFLTVF